MHNKQSNPHYTLKKYTIHKHNTETTIQKNTIIKINKNNTKMKIHKTQCTIHNTQ